MSQDFDPTLIQQEAVPGQFKAPLISELDAALDQFEFLEVLGQGGMGAVYKARQPKLDRDVAIKILPSFDDEVTRFQFAERFRREAQALAKLNHPSIVSVHDFGETKTGQLFFAMEFVNGTDLQKLIQTDELTDAHFFSWIPQICNALQYAHSCGIVHRDIKPANILITQEGQVKVADFGLAKLTEGEPDTSLTLTQGAMGTPDYIAPEVLESPETADHRADIYALGVLMYQMLTGKIPRGVWKPPTFHTSGLDVRYDELVTRAMEHDPNARYQEASQIKTSLSTLQTQPLLDEADVLPAESDSKPKPISGLMIAMVASWILAAALLILLIVWPKGSANTETVVSTAPPVPSSVTLEPATPSPAVEEVLPIPPPPAKGPLTIPVGWTNVLDGLTLDPSGTWSQSVETGLRGESEGIDLLSLPSLLPGNYNFQAQIALSGGGPLGVAFPVADRTALLFLDHPTENSWIAFHKETMTEDLVFEDGLPHLLEISVRLPREDFIEIRVHLDRRKLIEYSGSPARLQIPEHWPSLSKNQLGIGYEKDGTIASVYSAGWDEQPGSKPPPRPPKPKPKSKGMPRPPLDGKEFPPSLVTAPINSLESSFSAAFKKEATAPFQKGLLALNRKYIVSLERFKSAKNASIVSTEIDLIKANKGIGTDDSSLLAAHRKIYTEELDKLTQDREQAALPILRTLNHGLSRLHRDHPGKLERKTVIAARQRLVEHYAEVGLEMEW